MFTLLRCKGVHKNLLDTHLASDVTKVFLTLLKLAEVLIAAVTLMLAVSYSGDVSSR